MGGGGLRALFFFHAVTHWWTITARQKGMSYWSHPSRDILGRGDRWGEADISLP